MRSSTVDVSRLSLSSSSRSPTFRIGQSARARLRSSKLLTKPRLARPAYLAPDQTCSPGAAAEFLKRGIEAKAAREHRSLSAQVEHELTEALRKDTVRGPVKAGKLLGRLPGGKVPSDDEFKRARPEFKARAAGGPVQR